MNHPLTRRNFLHAATAAGASILLSRSARAAAPGRPNVLFVAVDDLNDWIGCMGGHPQVKTPHIDRLAARGTLFTNAHCQSPLCNPCRASMLSGLRPSTTGLYTLQPGVRAVPALADRVMLPQHFQQNGYATFCAGKIYHDGSVKRGDPTTGFDTWGNAGPFAYPPQKFVDTPDKIKAMDWGAFPEKDEDQCDWKIATSAIDYFKARPADKPFFMGVGFRLPHVPLFVPQKWFDLYPDESLIMPKVLENDRDDVPEFAWRLHWKLPEPRLSWLKKAGQWRPLVRAYLASTSYMDAQVGRLLDALDASGQADNTVVVLWSDHGWHLGEKDISGKNTLWDRSTRVPMMLAGPGIAAGQRCGQPAELLDLYPTLIDLCNLPPQAGLEGHTLLPQLKDANARRSWPAITTHNIGNHGIRTERWRYIRYADGSEESYDMQSDPNEWKNRAKDPAYASVIREHAKFLPTVNTPAVPGSAHRLLEQQDGVWMWEGKRIVPEELER